MLTQRSDSRQLVLRKYAACGKRSSHPGYVTNRSWTGSSAKRIRIHEIMHHFEKSVECEFGFGPPSMCGVRVWPCSQGRVAHNARRVQGASQGM